MRTEVRVTYACICLLPVTLPALAQTPKPPTYLLSAPAGSAYTQIDKTGRTVLPNGRFITPRGKQIETAPHPYGLVLSPDGQTVVTANSGISPFSVSIIQNALTGGRPGSAPAVRQVPDGPKTDNGILETCFMGLAVSPDSKPAVGGSSPNSVVATDRYVFVSNGNNDCVSVIDVNTSTVIKNITLLPGARLGSKRGVDAHFGLVLSPNGQRLFVAEVGINAVAVVDVATLTVLGHIPTGWFPSKLKVSNDGTRLIVANAKGFGSGPNGGKAFKLSDRGSYIGSLMNGTDQSWTYRPMVI